MGLPGILFCRFLFLLATSWTHAMHVPLLTFFYCFVLFVCWSLCLVRYLHHHNFKKLLLKSGYITSNYLILPKNPVNIPTMKTSYHLNPSPFHYGTNTPPDHKLLNLFGTAPKAVSKSTCKIKLLVCSWQWTWRLQLYPPNYQWIWWHCHQDHPLSILLQTLVLNLPKPCIDISIYKCFWSHAVMEITNIKNDNRTHKLHAFQKAQNTFFNYLASNGCLWWLLPSLHT